MMQLECAADTPLELPAEKISAWYDQLAQDTKELMFAKNHDYGEAWRERASVH